MPNDPMRLAKPQIDIGLFTNDLTGHLAFWREAVGLRLDHVLDIGAGRWQHRFDAHGSVIKVNHAAQPIASAPPSGLAELAIAHDAPALWQGVDPDGDRVRLVPGGSAGVVGIGVTLGTPDVRRMMDFYTQALGFEALGEQAVRAGDSRLFFVEGERRATDAPIFATGFRYLTVQIFDADAAHRHVLAHGGREGMPPHTPGDIARISFVLDPDGNWIELSARASLIGHAVPRDA